MNNELEQLKRELQELKDWKKSLEASHSIPLNIHQAFTARFVSAGSIRPSSKSASSENVTAVVSVNFGAQTVGTNTVLDNPDAFLEVVVGNTTYYIPVFT